MLNKPRLVSEGNSKMRMGSLVFNNLRSWLGVSLGAIAGLTFPLITAVPMVGAQSVTVDSTDVQMVRDGNVVTVSAKIRVRNQEAEPVTGLFLVGQDRGFLSGLSMHVGTVPPKGDVVTEDAYTFTVNLADTPMRNFMIPITLQFFLGGEPRETTWTLTHSLIATQ